MRTRSYTLLILLLILALVPASAPCQTPAEGHVPGIVLVKFKPGTLRVVAPRLAAGDVLTADLKGLLQQAGFAEGRKIFQQALPGDTLAISQTTGEPVTLIDLSHWYALKVADTTDVVKLVERLSRQPGVEAASPSFELKRQDIFPNDPSFQSGLQWGLYNYSSPGKDVHAPQAWEKNKGRTDVIVAVVDGGVDYNHADLDPGDRSRVIQGTDTANDDGNPMDDIPDGYGFAGHGTKVAGVIGAITNNSNKVAGVMWNVKVMPVKVANTSGPWWDPFNWSIGAAYDWNIADGIDYARNNGANIINLSLGGDGVSWWTDAVYNNPLTQASLNAYRQGVLLAAAMGNDGQNVIQYPAGFPWVTAVGATTSSDLRASFSNMGDHIDVVAPGESHYTLFRNNSQGYFSGTSCATPMVAGVAGLILSESRDLGLNLNNDDIKHLMEVTANDKGAAGFDVEYGYGRVNADAALALINTPNTVLRSTATGGTSTLVWNTHSHVFYNGSFGGGSSLASGSYNGVKSYKVTKHVTFPTPYTQAPKVWIRESQISGWNAANPNYETPYALVKNVTTTGFDYETYVFWIGSNAAGQQINAYYPVSPSQVQVAYTAVGTPVPLTASISGPSTLGVGQMGTWTAVASGGQSPTVTVGTTCSSVPAGEPTPSRSRKNAMSGIMAALPPAIPKASAVTSPWS